jgi:hypothetical protein
VALRSLKVPTFLLAAMHVSAITYACDMHGSGGFGGFVQFHPLVHQGFQKELKPSFFITHPKQAKVKVDEQATLVISYLLSPLYQDVKVRFVASEYIQFTEGSYASLHGGSGTHRLGYIAKQAGQQKISLHIEGLKNGSPFSRVQVIDLFSS